MKLLNMLSKLWLCHFKKVLFDFALYGRIRQYSGRIRSIKSRFSEVQDLWTNWTKSWTNWPDSSIKLKALQGKKWTNFWSQSSLRIPVLPILPIFNVNLLSYFTSISFTRLIMIMHRKTSKTVSLSYSMLLIICLKSPTGTK